jgi:hypothetical protein
MNGYLRSVPVPELHRFEEHDGIPAGAIGAHCRHCGEEAGEHPARVCGCYGCDADASGLIRWPGRRWPLPACALHFGGGMAIAESVGVNATFEPLNMHAVVWSRRRGDA